MIEKVLRGKPTAVGAATGGVAVILSITAFVCFYAVSYKHKVKIDDALDTYPVHGVGGTVGALLTGIFTTTAINSAGKNGLLYGNPGELLVEIAAIIIAYAIAGLGTLIILKLIDATIALHTKEDAEIQGLDIYEHGEEGYNQEFSDPINIKSRYVLVTSTRTI